MVLSGGSESEVCGSEWGQAAASRLSEKAIWTGRVSVQELDVKRSGTGRKAKIIWKQEEKGH